MKIPLKSLLVLVVLFFVAIACQKEEAFIDDAMVIDDTMVIEEPQAPKSYPGVASSLWPYFERFEQAGVAQGVKIDLSEAQITGIVEDIESNGVAGQCNYYSHSPNHIIVDSEFWSRASDAFKEMIVFHELGHCVLNRDHREGSLESGLCLSIMRSGEQPCRDAYTTTTRDYYIEELFHPQRIK